MSAEIYCALAPDERELVAVYANDDANPGTRSSRMDMRRRSLLAAIAKGEDIEHEKLDPIHAMRALLSHVQLDPDGGLTNLDNEHLSYASAQVTKIPSLQKAGLEKGLAVLVILRVCANIGFITRTSTLVVAGYLWNIEGYYHEHLRAMDRMIDLPVPLTELTVVLFLIEFIVAVCLTLGLLWDVVCFFLVDAENRPEQACSPRFLRLSRLFWKDLPILQTFSLLRVLEYVHPNLIMKRAKEFSWHDDASRMLLERLLKTPENSKTDEQLVQEVTKVLMSKAHVDVQNEEVRQKLTDEYLSLKPHKLIARLRSLPNAQRMMEEHGGLDTQVFSQMWRLSMVVFVEKLGFFLLCLSLFSLGFLSFLVKICFVAVILMEHSKLWALVSVLILLNQVTSIISVNQLLMWRVEKFVFGGPDAEVSVEEKYIIDVYLANLAQKIWESHHLTRMNKLAIYLQLDDDDIQQLIVEEDAIVKSGVILTVNHYLREAGQAPVRRIPMCV